MTRTRFLATACIALAAAAFVAGYWPQRQGRVSAENSLAAAEVRISQLEARDRVSRLLGSLLSLQDSVAAQNFGEAAGQSSRFFDDVRSETGRAEAATQPALDLILRRRDEVTSALARGDASVGAVLRQTQLELRRALGFSAPQEAARQ